MKKNILIIVLIAIILITGYSFWFRPLWIIVLEMNWVQKIIKFLNKIKSIFKK